MLGRDNEEEMILLMKNNVIKIFQNVKQRFYDNGIKSFVYGYDGDSDEGSGDDGSRIKGNGKGGKVKRMQIRCLNRLRNSTIISKGMICVILLMLVLGILYGREEADEFDELEFSSYSQPSSYSNRLKASDGGNALSYVGNSIGNNEGLSISSSAIFLFPFNTFNDAYNFTMNKSTTKWWEEMASNGNIILLVLDGLGTVGDAKDSLVFPYLHSKYTNNIFVINGFRKDQLSEEMKELFIRKSISSEFQTLYALGSVSILLNKDGKSNKIFNPLKDLKFDSIAIIPDGVYVDPNDLRDVMDAYSLIPEKDDTIITFEGTSAIVSKEIFVKIAKEMKNEPNSLMKLSSALLNLEQTTKELGDIPGFVKSFGVQTEKLNELYQQKKLSTKNQNIRSCTLPGWNYGYQDIKIESFKRCSFVNGIKNIYEYHAIRSLQRISRKLPLEVDWKQDQNKYKERHCDIAIGITTVPHKFFERELVRKTWGKLARSIGTIRVFFHYGTPEAEPTADIAQKLKEEQELHNDIVILPITEGYFRMFTKVATMFGWSEANTNCATVMKVDPDTYLRIFPLYKFMFARKILPLSASYLPSGDKQAGAYFGLIGHSGTNKDFGHKWYFYDVWPHDFIPPFMTGAGMGMSRQLAKYVYERRLPDRRLDDPGVGLILHGLSVGTNKLRLETGSEWKDGTHDLNRCSNDKILENPFFLKDFDMKILYKYDLKKNLFCEHTKGTRLPPRALLHSRDIPISTSTSSWEYILKALRIY